MPCALTLIFQAIQKITGPFPFGNEPVLVEISGIEPLTS